MKKIKIIYWIFTGILSVLILMGSIPNMLSSHDSQEMFKHLGYPMYLLPLLGLAKTLGIIAILLPGFPRIKEWAYAGLFFDLTGAFYSGVATGDPIVQWLPLLVGHVLIFGSYIYHHKLLAARAAAGGYTEEVGFTN
jgi:hypothetical protein